MNIYDLQRQKQCVWTIRRPEEYTMENSRNFHGGVVDFIARHCVPYRARIPSQPTRLVCLLARHGDRAGKIRLASVGEPK